MNTVLYWPLIFDNLQLLLFTLIPDPQPKGLLSAVETVRRMALSTSTPTRPLHLASVTHQATGHLRRLSVSVCVTCSNIYTDPNTDCALSTNRCQYKPKWIWEPVGDACKATDELSTLWFRSSWLEFGQVNKLESVVARRQIVVLLIIPPSISIWLCCFLPWYIPACQ